MGREGHRIRGGIFTSVNLCSPRTVRRLLADRGLTLDRRRGQNFLIDRNIVNRLVALAEPTPADLVLDLGAGLGTMTAALATKTARVVAVELDPGILSVARDLHAEHKNVRWVQGDLRDLSWADLLGPESERSVKVVSNLPYNVSKLVLRRLLERIERFQCLVITVQREVAERLLAAPGGKTYGPLAVACHLNAVAAMEALVPPTCFYPRPHVESAVVKLKPWNVPPAPRTERNQVMKLVRSAFSQRRKTLVNALAASPGFASGDRLRAALGELDLPPDVRAERVSPQDFLRLRRILES